MRVEISTNNEIRLGGEVKGGYHECHNMTGIVNISHLIATIDSIIKNNLLYACKSSVLKDVLVECDDANAVEYLNDYKNELFRYPDVKVSIWLMYE